MRSNCGGVQAGFVGEGDFSGLTGRADDDGAR